MHVEYPDSTADAIEKWWDTWINPREPSGCTRKRDIEHSNDVERASKRQQTQRPYSSTGETSDDTHTLKFSEGPQDENAMGQVEDEDAWPSRVEDMQDKVQRWLFSWNDIGKSTEGLRVPETPGQDLWQDDGYSGEGDTLCTNGDGQHVVEGDSTWGFPNPEGAEGGASIPQCPSSNHPGSLMQSDSTGQTGGLIGSQHTAQDQVRDELEGDDRAQYHLRYPVPHGWSSHTAAEAGYLLIPGYGDKRKSTPAYLLLHDPLDPSMHLADNCATADDKIRCKIAGCPSYIDMSEEDAYVARGSKL